MPRDRRAAGVRDRAAARDDGVERSGGVHVGVAGARDHHSGVDPAQVSPAIVPRPVDGQREDVRRRELRVDRAGAVDDDRGDRGQDEGVPDLPEAAEVVALLVKHEAAMTAEMSRSIETVAPTPG